MTPKSFARLHHDYSERLAPGHGYKAREGGPLPFEHLPEMRRNLMVATMEALMEAGKLPGVFTVDAHPEGEPRRPRVQTVAELLRLDPDVIGLALAGGSWDADLEDLARAEASGTDRPPRAQVLRETHARLVRFTTLEAGLTEAPPTAAPAMWARDGDALLLWLDDKIVTVAESNAGGWTVRGRGAWKPAGLVWCGDWREAVEMAILWGTERDVIVPMVDSCDGNHAMPECGSGICWHGPPPPGLSPFPPDGAVPFDEPKAAKWVKAQGHGWTMLVDDEPVVQLQAIGGGWVAKPVGEWRSRRGGFAIGSWASSMSVIQRWAGEIGVHVPPLAELVTAGPLAVHKGADDLIDGLASSRKAGDPEPKAHPLTAACLDRTCDDIHAKPPCDAVDCWRKLGGAISLEGLAELTGDAPGQLVGGERTTVGESKPVEPETDNPRWEGGGLHPVKLVVNEEVVVSIAKEGDYIVECHNHWWGTQPSAVGSEAEAIALIIEIGINHGVEVPPFFEVAEGTRWVLDEDSDEVWRLLVGGVVVSGAYPPDGFPGGCWTLSAWTPADFTDDKHADPSLRAAVGEIIRRAALQGIGVPWPAEWPEAPAAPSATYEAIANKLGRPAAEAASAEIAGAAATRAPWDPGPSKQVQAFDQAAERLREVLGGGLSAAVATVVEPDPTTDGDDEDPDFYRGELRRFYFRVRSAHGLGEHKNDTEMVAQAIEGARGLSWNGEGHDKIEAPDLGSARAELLEARATIAEMRHDAEAMCERLIERAPDPDCGCHGCTTRTERGEG